MKKQSNIEQDILSLDMLCQKLSISIATGRNWIRLNKIQPQYWVNEKPFFSYSYATDLKQKLTSGEFEQLKSRRNKNYICGNQFYASYLNAKSSNTKSITRLLDLVLQEKGALSENELRTILCECALKLFCNAFVLPEKGNTTVALLPLFIKGTYHLPPYDALLFDLIPSPKQALSFYTKYPEFFSIPFTYTPQEDLLGLLYLSLKNMGKRKTAGAYYTPTVIVNKLLLSLQTSLPTLMEKKILDPCCGTGNFLLHLPKQVSLSHVYGNDIDKTSVLLTRINLALYHKPTDLQLLYKNITQSDFLLASSKKKYDCIIGNPPWGYTFSPAKKETLRKRYQCIHGRQIESYDLFIERSLSQLPKGGILSFVLPEAFLHTQIHAPIRKQLLDTSSIAYLEYLGNVFSQVNCPSILLELHRTDKSLSAIGTKVKTKHQSFVIKKERHLTPCQFDLFIPDTMYAILDKLLHCPNTTTLQKQADFALGIVTGDNKHFLEQQKNEKNECILKGTEISPFVIQPAKNYITYSPNDYQQVAKTKYYRAPEKLLYRFISKKLVFAYDDKQRLSLNSCNLVIPKIPELPIKYVLAVLNSSMAQFIFQNLFHSVKVLRSHIEQIPIPIADTETINKCIFYVDQLLLHKKKDQTFEAIYLELDQLLADLFHLTKEEYHTILNNM